MAKYGRKASEKVETAMRERKRGTLKSGKSGNKVRSRKQAIAIGLAQARRAGAKVPPSPRKSRTSKRKAAPTAKRRTTKRASTGAKKATRRSSRASR